MTTTRPTKATTKETAAALRRHLRAAYPHTKFSVTMSRGTAALWLNVSWTDGPTYSEVREITSQYESSRFDGMDDTYKRTGNEQWTCCGVLTQRRLSPERIDDAHALIRTNDEGERFIDADGVYAVGSWPGDDDEVVALLWLAEISL